MGGAELMKQQAANLYIALVAALGVIVLITSSINLHTSSIDPVMFIFILVLVGIAQRNPVVLFRSSAISVAFAVKIAAYVLFGTPVAMWTTLVVVAVNAYTPKPKPARKVFFNFGQLALSTFFASSTYQLLGGMVPPGAFVPTMHHALAVARSLGLGPDEIAAVNLGALFHDIGKIGIPEHILRKPTQLTEEEWSEMKTHPIIGANLIGEVPNLEQIRPIVLAHHEHYDGTGYPHGLKGDQIPLAAQIISVADTYEAMTSTRPYRPALSHETAVAELRRVSGTQLNPLVVDAFIRQLEMAPADVPQEP